MNPQPFVALNHLTVPVSLNAFFSFSSRVNLQSDDQSQSKERLRSNFQTRKTLTSTSVLLTLLRTKRANPTHPATGCQLNCAITHGGYFRRRSLFSCERWLLPKAANPDIMWTSGM